jgi:hypothetical protein
LEEKMPLTVPIFKRDAKNSDQISIGSPVVLEKLLDSEDVGLALGIHPATVQRLAARGEIPGFKVGKY